ncbi:Gfo/Idh/MocA family oxidoreductase [bacterium]|nr:Gfo/Idh/MocA family oxidoreductase [bacterium]
MIRIGIVGCGRILAAHLRGFRLLREAGIGDFIITALASRDDKDARGYIDRQGSVPQRRAVSMMAGDPLAIGDEFISDFQDPALVRVYSTYEDLTASRDVDAVMDLTTHRMHHLVAKSAFDHRKHLLSQKPLAATMRAGRAMLDGNDQAGVTFGTFECFRFLPQTEALSWLFRTGRGGTLQMMLYGYIGAWWAPNRIVADTPWRHQRVEGGGITVDIGVHFFDQMFLLAGLPRRITGRAHIIEPRRFSEKETIICDADDTVWASIDFVTGVTAQLSASWAGHGGATTWGSGSVFIGSKAKVDGDIVTFDDGRVENLLELYRRESGVLPTLPGVDDWFALAQQDWLQAIRLGKQPESSATQGLLNLAASLAILESSVAGQTIEFDEVWTGDRHAYQDPIDRALGLR